MSESKPNLHSTCILFEHEEDCLRFGDLAFFYQSHSGAKYVTFEHVWYRTIVISENNNNCYTSTRYF